MDQLTAYQNIIIEYFNTTDNSRRQQLHPHVIDKITNNEQILLLKTLLTTTQNPKVLTYCISVLSKNVLESPQHFIGLGIELETIALKISMSIPQIKNLALELYTSCVIGMWQYEHNTQQVVEMILQLSQQSTQIFFDISNLLIETFRKYQSNPAFPKKLESDFRNNILVVILKTVGNMIIQFPKESCEILKNAMFVMNITQADETDEFFTFCPSRDGLHLYLTFIDSLYKYYQYHLNYLIKCVHLDHHVLK